MKITRYMDLLPIYSCCLLMICAVLGAGLLSSLAYRAFGPAPYSQRIANAESTARVLAQIIVPGMSLRQAEAIIRAKGFKADEFGRAVIASRTISEFFNECEIRFAFPYDITLLITDSAAPPHKACGSL